MRGKGKRVENKKMGAVPIKKFNRKNSIKEAG